MPDIKNNCIVTIKSRQVMLGEEETSDIIVPGFKTVRNGKTYISYTVYYDEDRECKNKETVKILSSDTVELIRHGFFNSKMLFKKGESCVCDYSSHMVHTMLTIDTLDVSVKESEGLTEIYLEYKIDMDTDAAISIFFTLTAENSGSL